VRAGLLNKRATFQALVTQPDGAGGTTTNWTDYITVWASFAPDRAREKIQQGRIADAQSGVLRVRSSTQSRAIDDTYRVVLGGVTYNIRSHTNPDGVNDALEFLLETDGSQPSAATP
jgi:SPP1 family predicted phage head-tail adaptor